MRYIYKSFYIVLFIICMICDVVHADNLTADAIMMKANQSAYYAGKDGRADIKMTITAGNGNTRIREFTILRINLKDSKQKFYVYFHKPVDVRKMAFLVWKNPNGNDDRWLWLPALNLKKRIAPGDKRTSFIGSDFLYEDVSGRGLKEDIHELISKKDDYYIIKNTPKDTDSVEFSYYNLWINEKTFLPEKAEYYDKNGLLYRRIESILVKNVDGFPTVVESLASDLRTGSSTKNIFNNIKYNIGLKERVFTERFLRRPPREVIR